MQIFATSPDPMQAARWLDDKRVNKMVTETAQIICTVLADDGIKGLPFKPTHESHPVVKWAAARHRNLNWIAQHHTALVLEWTHRFVNQHASGLPREILSHIPPGKPPETFHNGASNQSLDLDFTWCEDVHTAYKMYLGARWINTLIKPKWTKRGSPVWSDITPCEDYDLLMLYVKETQNRIGKDRNGLMPCTRCGGDLKYYNARHFECTENKGCLSWQEISW